MIEKLRDPRWLWLLFLICIIIPLVRPIGLPMGVSDNTVKVYEAIKSVPSGGLVFLSPDYALENRGELQAILVATLKCLLQKDVKIVSAGFYGTTSPMMMDEAMKTVGLENYGKKYGEDFVNLGYLPGEEATIAALGVDIHALVRVDFYNKPISEIPLMDHFRSAEDIDLVISIAAGNDYPDKWIRQWQVKYGTKITGGAVAMIYPMMVSYVASGQLKGYLDSSRGAAEFELLTKNPGEAIITMDAQSIGHIVAIVAIVICNLNYVISKKEGRA